MRDDAPTPPTLGSLAPDVEGVFCWCNRCGHNPVLRVAVLIAHCGPCAVQGGSSGCNPFLTRKS